MTSGNEIGYELNHAIDVANNIARQCGRKFRVSVDVKYIVEFPDYDYHQYNTQSDACSAIDDFNANIAFAEAQRRLSISDPDADFETRKRLEEEVDLIMERAQ